MKTGELIGRAHHDGTLSVVIVSYRTPAMLRSCLEQLTHETAVRRVVVVDNASDDGSAELVEQRFPHVELVRNAENVGFAKAVNHALGLCDDEYLLLLNPDTVLEPDTLNLMLDLLAKNPSVGAVGPAIRHPTGRLKVLSAGKQPTVWRIFTHATMLSRLSRRIPALEGMNLLLGIHDDRQRDVEWLTGACLLLRRDALDAVGLLTERWFMYAEDFELCLRLHRAGWRLVHLPAARMMHHMGASADPDDAPSTAWAETLHDFYRTDISAGIFADIVWRAVFASQLLSRSMYYLLRARRSPDSDSGGSISRQAWLREARGFAASARAVLRDRDNTVDPQPTCSSVAPGSGIDEFQPTP